MNKGLKAHLSTAIVYIIMLLIVLVGNNSVTNEVRYILACGFIALQMGIGMICYMEEWYENNNKPFDTKKEEILYCEDQAKQYLQRAERLKKGLSS